MIKVTRGNSEDFTILGIYKDLVSSIYPVFTFKTVARTALIRGWYILDYSIGKYI